MVGTLLIGFIIGVIMMFIIQCIYIIQSLKEEDLDKEDKDE